MRGLPVRASRPFGTAFEEQHLARGSVGCVGASPPEAGSWSLAMAFFLRRFAAAALAGSVLLVYAAPDVFAQRRVFPGTGNPLAQPLNPVTRSINPAVLPFPNINGAPINPNF